MQKSIFNVLVCKAQPRILKHFAKVSKNLTNSQRNRLHKMGGVA